MTLDEIKALIDAMSTSDLVEVEINKDGWTLRLTRDAGNSAFTPSIGEARAMPPAAPARPESPRRESASSVESTVCTADVSAPLSGVVYLGPSPDAPPFVAVGQKVTSGTILCTVEAMKMFNPVAAERDGVVKAVFVSTGDEVAAGQPLLRIV
jgi:acetyl-CoA carboxylase biotin carboxyl carrier protein